MSIAGAVRSRIRLSALRARKLSRVLGHADYRRALRRGVLAATEHHDSGLSADASTVLDVGASHGQFALYARHRWRNAEIVCFEPIPTVADKLRSVLGHSATVHCTALGSQAGVQPLNLSRSDDSSSLLPIGRQAVEFPRTDRVGSIEVQVATLAEYLGVDSKRPVVLKIDVQGYELEVLRGAGRELEYVDEILCECSFVELYRGQPVASDVIGYLQARGFRLAHIAGITTSGSGAQLQADFLFRRG